MPLIQSGKKEAMGKNIKAEMHAGKPQKQAIAIAYNVMRKNRKKKMASGGEVDKFTGSPVIREPMPAEEKAKSLAERRDVQAGAQYVGQGGFQKKYEGGFIDNHDLHPGSPVISEAPQGYVFPPHARRPKDHYSPAAEDLPAGMYAGGGMAHDPKHIAIIITSRKKGGDADMATDVTGGYAHGGGVGYPTPKDPHYADGGETEKPSMVERIRNFSLFQKTSDSPLTAGFKKAVDKKNAQDSGNTYNKSFFVKDPHYSEGGEVDHMDDDESMDEDSEAESLPFEDDDAVPIPTILKGYDSAREDTEGMHDRKNRHGVIRNIMRGLHRKHYGT